MLELLAANGEHLRLFAGICAMDSQSKFLLSVAHAIFFLRPANVLYLSETMFGISAFVTKQAKIEIILKLKERKHYNFKIDISKLFS